MNVDLRYEYKEETKDHGALSEDERKNRYLMWLEDKLTEERNEVKKFIISGVGRSSLKGREVSCPKCGGNDISWSTCNSCGYDPFK